MTTTTTPSCEEMPTKLGTASRFAVVSPDKLSVKLHPAGGCRNGMIGCVLANKPVPANMAGTVYYFEMRVKNVTAKTMVSIGYTGEAFNLTHHLGCTKDGDADSVGYHGHVGFCYFVRKHHTSDIVLEVSPGAKYTTNDVVGAGINYTCNEFFFTKNGELVKTFKEEFDGPLYPAVSVYGPEEEIKVNFGRKPFVYDIKAIFPCPYCRRPDDKSWKKLVEEKEILVKEKEALSRKLLEEKEKGMASLKAAKKAMSDDFQKYI